MIAAANPSPNKASAPSLVIGPIASQFAATIEINPRPIASAAIALSA